MDIGTYHGIFARAIRECDGHAPLSARFTILDGPDQKALLADAYTGWKGEEEWKAFKEDNKVDDVIEEFSKYRMSLLPGQPEYVSESGIADLPGLHRVYTDAKRLEDVADYDDILFAFDVALENPRILALFQSKWKMILVDEYQDTNEIQSRIVQKLAARYRNLTCVGDDDQSIYGWRGADVRNILGFETQWKGAHVVRLEHNFRSRAEILQIANALIGCNVTRHGKILRATKDKGDSVRIVKHDNSYDEADAVVGSIERLLRSKVPRSEVAVIARTATALASIEQRLVRSKPPIPYTMTAGRKVSERMELKVIAAYARSAINVADQTAFLYAFESRRRKTGKTGLSKYRESARSADTTVEAVMRQDVATAGEKQRDSARWRGMDSFLRGLDEIRALVDLGMTPRQVVEAIIEVSEIQATIDDDLEKAARSKDRQEKESAAKLAKTRQDNLEEILASADEVDELVDLTTNIVLSNEKQEDDSEAVWLGTIHGAKGLEFAHVFLPGFEAGTLPSPRIEAPETSLEYQEERNLAYVAITRAKESLTISYAMERRVFGQLKEAGASPFLKELGEGYSL